MTREKAIKHLETMKSDYALIGDIEALDMAISVLSKNIISNRYARWVEVNGKLLCSCCSQGNAMNYKYPFCHWCGADMRGE